MKKFLDLSSWSRFAAIGSIFVLAFLAACSTPTVSSDDSDENSEKVEQEDRSSSSDMSNSKEADRSSSSEKKTESSRSENLLESSDVSADKVESSSSGVKKTSWSYLNPDIVYSEIIDERDGQAYKIVKIGDQWWMAENLNYAYTGVPYDYSGNTSDSTSWCYGNDPANCTKYGRLYTWAAAMDSVGTWSTNGKGCGDGKTCSPTYPVRGICLTGWHLPSQAEWNTLFQVVGGSSTAGKALNSQSGWYSNGKGTDPFGFSALPAGGRDHGGSFNGVGYGAYFWSSTEGNGYYAYLMYSYYGSGGASLDINVKYYGFSVRCLKD